MTKEIISKLILCILPLCAKYFSYNGKVLDDIRKEKENNTTVSEHV